MLFRSQVDARPEPNPLNHMVTKMNSLQSTVQEAVNIANNPSTPTITRMPQDTPSNHPNLIGDTNRLRDLTAKESPSFKRAMNRAVNGSEPEGFNQHFSYGNKNA